MLAGRFGVGNSVSRRINLVSVSRRLESTHLY